MLLMMMLLIVFGVALGKTIAEIILNLIGAGLQFIHAAIMWCCQRMRGCAATPVLQSVELLLLLLMLLLVMW